MKFTCRFKMLHLQFLSLSSAYIPAAFPTTPWGVLNPTSKQQSLFPHP